MCCSFSLLLLLVCLVVSLSGLAPFSSRDGDADGLRNMIRGGRFSFPGPQWTPVSPSAKELVRALLTVDPAKRMTIEQAEVHPWMNIQAGKNKRKDTATPAAAETPDKKRNTAASSPAAASNK